jgi:hypothetical protein
VIDIPHEVVQELYVLSQQIREHEEAIETLRAKQVAALAQLKVNPKDLPVAADVSAGSRPLRRAAARHLARPTLNNAIVEIFRKNGNQPLRVRQILEQLIQSGFAFHGQDPAKTLTIRIYQCRDVERLGDGQFRAEPSALTEAEQPNTNAAFKDGASEIPKKRSKGGT